MLIERSFEIGATLCVGASVLFALAVLLSGVFVDQPMLLLTPVLFFVVGCLFLATARQARRDRMELLALGEAPFPHGPRTRRRS